MSKPRTLDPPESTSRTALPATQRFVPLAYRVDDAAAVIGVSDGKVWRLIREGRLPARKLDGSTIIRQEDLIAFINDLPLARELVETPPIVPKPTPAAPPRQPKVRPSPPPTPPAVSPPLVPTATYRRGPLSPDKIFRTPTPGLATVIGPDPIRRPEALAKLWDYIRAHALQAEVDRRIIIADPNLKAAFGLERVSMHDLNRLVKARLSPGWDDDATPDSVTPQDTALPRRSAGRAGTSTSSPPKRGRGPAGRG
ncbi:MAG: SWIB/MDM2 domain-containing protein [Janthinobacterium lividum]